MGAEETGLVDFFFLCCGCALGPGACSTNVGDEKSSVRCRPHGARSSGRGRRAGGSRGCTRVSFFSLAPARRHLAITEPSVSRDHLLLVRSIAAEANAEKTLRNLSGNQRHVPGGRARGPAGHSAPHNMDGAAARGRWLRTPSPRDWGAAPYLVVFGVLGTLARIGLVEQFACYNFETTGAGGSRMFRGRCARSGRQVMRRARARARGDVLFLPAPAPFRHACVAPPRPGRRRLRRPRRRTAPPDRRGEHGAPPPRPAPGRPLLRLWRRASSHSLTSRCL